MKAKFKVRSGNTWAWVTDDGMAGLTAFTLVIHNIAWSDTNGAFWPEPNVATITKQGPLPNNGPTIKVTAYVDIYGNLVADTSSYVAGFPYKKRDDDLWCQRIYTQYHHGRWKQDALTSVRSFGAQMGIT